MKPSFLLFVVVVILGFVGGYFVHEASDEKIRFERDQCIEYTQKYPYQELPKIISGDEYNGRPD